MPGICAKSTRTTCQKPTKCDHAALVMVRVETGLCARDLCHLKEGDLSKAHPQSVEGLLAACA